MAEQLPAVNDILSSLESTPLAGMAAQASAQIASLSAVDPDLPDLAVPARYDQIRILREAILYPLKSELENLRALPGLANELGLTEGISLIIGNGETGREVDFATPAHKEALGRVIEELKNSIDEAEQEPLRRDPPS